jgi:hypothetical protein
MIASAPFSETPFTTDSGAAMITSFSGSKRVVLMLTSGGMTRMPSRAASLQTAAS